MSFNIAVVLYTGAEELDFVGPYEVFRAASRLVAKEWNVVTVANQPVVRGNHGLCVNVDFTFDDAPPADVVLVPGGDLLREPELSSVLTFLRQVAPRAQYVTSVCTGAFFLYHSGQLTGRRATTHWNAMEMLRGLDGVTAVDGERWVRDGNVITAAGVSAGIDMALYLLGQIVSPAAARDVQRYMEYYPQPPYQEPPAP